MYCSKCGAKINQDAKFCEKCGSQVGIVETNSERLQPKKKFSSKKLFLIVLGIILILYGGSLLDTAENGTFLGDPSVRAEKRAPYEKWGTISLIAGGVSLVFGIIYKEK